MSNREVYCCDGSSENDIVISGVSGRFGGSKNLEEFSNFLFGAGHASQIQHHQQYFEEIKPGYSLQNVTKFDAKFFNVSENAAQRMDPQLRILCEIVHETIVDAGYTTDELTKLCVGIFCGGSCMNFLPSQISQIFKLKGPCFMAKNTSISFLLAVNEAYSNLSQNGCDAAIVTGIELESLSINPALGSNAEEHIGAILLQKAKKARRIYATIVNIERRMLQAKLPGDHTSSNGAQMELCPGIAQNNCLSTSSMLFLEQHNPYLSEILSHSSVLRNDQEPLLFLDASKNYHKQKVEAFGFSQIVKAILCFQTRNIPVNTSKSSLLLSYGQDNLKIITKPTSWDGHSISLISIGRECLMHVCLQRKVPTSISSRNTIERELSKTLVLYSGRSKEEIQSFFDYIRGRPEKKEFFYLLQKLSFTPPSHSYRGFLLFQQKEPLQFIEKRRSKVRPLYYVFSSIGSQWPGMGLDLMKYDVFARSLNKANEVLKKYQLNLIEVLKPNTNILYEKNHISATFAAITAIQIALLDLLTSLGLKPDGMIGHSAGEMACAYANGCCTAEQTILLAYWRGKALENANVPKGKMAVIGMSKEKARELCPKDVHIACHNSDELVTISGRVVHINKCLKMLKAKGINSHNVSTNDIAFHSPVIASAATELHKEISQVLSQPKQKSRHWISTCYSKEDQNLPEASLIDASYFVHNFLSPVLFREAFQEVPSDAVMLEIGPHCLFRGIIRQIMDSEAECLGLMKRNTDNAEFLLENMGKLYNLGFDPKIEALHPPYEFPVPSSTPMLANFVKWDHTLDWKIPWTLKRRIRIDLKAESSSFLIDHKMDDDIIFPASGYLVAVWQTLSNFKRKSIPQTPVVFKNFEIVDRCILQEKAITELDIEILKKNGHFRIARNNQLLATGLIHDLKPEDFAFDEPKYRNEESSLIWKKENIYDNLKSLGYNYGPEFQNILEAHPNGDRGLIKWNNNWVAYIESIISFMKFDFANTEADSLVKIDYVKIDPCVQNSILEKNSDGNTRGINVFHDKIISQCICGGVEISAMKTQSISKSRSTYRVICETRTFVPYIEECVLPTNQQSNRDEYYETCNNAATALIQLINNETLEKVEIINYSNTIPVQSQLLLSTLKNIVDGVQHKDEHLEHEFKTYLDYIEDDFLVRTFLSNTTFKKVFDIIEENCFSSTIHVFEINSHCNPLSVQLSTFLRKTNSKNWQFSILPDFSAFISSNSSNNELAKSDISNTETIADSVLICSFYSGSLPDLQTFVSLLSNVRNKFILVIYRSKMAEAEKVLRTVLKMSTDEHSATVFEQMLEQSDMCIIAKKSDSYGMHLYLLRKCTNVDNSLIYDLRKDKCDCTKIVANNFKNQTEKSSPLWLLIDNKSVNNVEDFHQEFRKKDVKFLYIEDQNLEENPLDTSDFKYDDVLKKNLVKSVFKNGQWGSHYHELVEDDPVTSFVCEFSERNQKSERYCGNKKQCQSSVVCSPRSTTWPSPSTWTFNEACTISYSIGYYGLILQAKLKEKQIIFIHDGTNTVSQAAINIALSLKCEIFITVDFPENYKYLTQIYTSLNPKHITVTADDSFKDAIFRGTEGKGVDVVFGSFSENQLKAALDCLAYNGQFVHYGKFDVSMDNAFDLCVLSNNVSLISIDIDALFGNQYKNACQEKNLDKIHKLMLAGISNGVVKPLHVAFLGRKEGRDSITHLKNEKGISKSIIKLRMEEEETKTVISPQSPTDLVIPVTLFYVTKTYIIIDGLTIFGKFLGEWLIKRGVKRIIVTTQQTLNDGENHFVESWRNLGTEVVVRNLTSSNLKEVSELLYAVEEKGPVGGIFVLTSGTFQIEDTIQKLDSESRSLCHSLDWFVCFSPSPCCKGYAKNASTNINVEKVYEQRCKDHLNGTMIHWDFIEGDNGMDWNHKSEMPTTLQRQLIKSFLVELDNILQKNKPVICCRFLQCDSI